MIRLVFFFAAAVTVVFGETLSGTVDIESSIGSFIGREFLLGGSYSIISFEVESLTPDRNMSMFIADADNYNRFLNEDDGCTESNPCLFYYHDFSLSGPKLTRNINDPIIIDEDIGFVRIALLNPYTDGDLTVKYTVVFDPYLTQADVYGWAATGVLITGIVCGAALLVVYCKAPKLTTYQSPYGPTGYPPSQSYQPGYQPPPGSGYQQTPGPSYQSPPPSGYQPQYQPPTGYSQSPPGNQAPPPISEGAPVTGNPESKPEQ